jgi:hypothetical protein
MAMTKTLWSINALATELDKDRRTLAKALSDVPPDGYVSGEKRWYLRTVLRALARPSRAAHGPGEDTFLDVLIDRVTNWRKIRSDVEHEPFPVELIAEASGATPAHVVKWLRGGMPFQQRGDWESGNGFLIPMAWAIDWQVFVTAYATNAGRDDLLRMFGLRI